MRKQWSAMDAGSQQERTCSTHMQAEEISLQNWKRWLWRVSPYLAFGALVIGNLQGNTFLFWAGFVSILGGLIFGLSPLSPDSGNGHSEGISSPNESMWPENFEHRFTEGHISEPMKRCFDTLRCASLLSHGISGTATCLSCVREIESLVPELTCQEAQLLHLILTSVRLTGCLTVREQLTCSKLTLLLAEKIHGSGCNLLRIRS